MGVRLKLSFHKLPRGTNCARTKNSDNQNEAENRQTEFCFPSRVKRPFLLEAEQYGGVQEPGNRPYQLELSKKLAKANAAANSKTAANEQG